MRTLCAILLLGVVTYVQADHDCSPLAVKVKESTLPSFSSNAAPPLPLLEFYEKIRGVFYVDEATSYETPEAQTYCIPARYSRVACGGIEYATKYHGNEFVIDENLLWGKAFETTSISFKLESSMQYTTTFAGVDPHNYIFKKVERIPIDAQTFPGNILDEHKPMALSLQIQTVFEMEFALFSYRPGPEGYNLFVSCDGKAAWATYRKGTNPTAEMNLALQGDIIKLVNRLAEIMGEGISLHKTSKTVDSTLSAYLTTLYNNN